MADQKISELTALTGANVADDDAIAIVDTSATETKKIVFSELKNALDTATGFVRITGDTMTGNLNMGDNVKAIFGAGSDLQIYHNAAHSVIEDVGQGDIYLNTNGAKINIYDSGNTQFLARFNAGTDVELYYNGDEKLATTATGIDVTGTITSDGLTVDTNTLHVDATNNRVGIGTDSPSAQFTSYKSLNGDPQLGHFYNDNSGAAAEAVIYITNSSTLADGLFLQTYGANGTTAGGFVQDASIIGSGTGASGGLSIMTRANADMRFYTNGHTNERMRIDSSGNVGIGTSSPSSKLHISQATDALASGLQIRNAADTSSLFIYQDGLDTKYDTGTSGSQIFRTNSAERMRIDSSGYITSTASNPQISFVDSANSSYKWSIQNTSSAIRFYDNTAASEAMRIDSSGNVGIGTSSTSTNYGAYKTPLIVEQSSGYGYVEIRSGTTANQAGLILNRQNNTGWLNAMNNTGKLRIAPMASINEAGLTNAKDGSTGITVDTSGRVGIGTTLPATDAALTVAASEAPNIFFQRSTSGRYDAAIGMPSSADLAFYNGTDSSTVSGLSERMRIDSSGNLLVGLTSISDATSRAYGNAFSGSSSNPNWKSWGSGAHTHAQFRNGTSVVGSITTTSSATTYNTSSDHRLKENVVDLTGATTRLKQLEPKRFNFIADADTTVDGFIAHEVQSVVPEAITGEHNEVDGDGNPVYQGIDQSKLVPLLVATIKELEARITALENA